VNLPRPGAPPANIIRLHHVRIRQYAEFGFSSQSMTAADITARLGIEPDKFIVRGSRMADPPMPAFHIWSIICEQRGLTLGEQAQKVIGRLRPRQREIADLISDPSADCDAGMSMVRYFNDEDGEEEELSPPDAPLQKLPGQHQLLGWHLDRETLAFLVSIGVNLDVDEYG
jgi:hypothetical protein